MRQKGKTMVVLRDMHTDAVIQKVRGTMKKFLALKYGGLYPVMFRDGTIGSPGPSLFAHNMTAYWAEAARPERS